MKYTSTMLPILGVKWTRFATLAEARKFAAWSERSTRRDEYPCEAFITEQSDSEPCDRYEVKVRNW